MTRELNRLLCLGMTILFVFPTAGYSQACGNCDTKIEAQIDAQISTEIIADITAEITAEITEEPNSRSMVGVAAAHASTGGTLIAASSIRHRVIFGASTDPAFVPRSRFEQTGVATTSWFSFDKVQHVTFGFLFTLGYQYSLVNKLEMSEKRALPVSIVGTAAIGLGKELYDWQYRSRHHFSKGDLIADSVGILLAVGLIVL